MRKGLLLAGAIFGATILADAANAVTIRIDEEKKVVFGARGIIDAAYKGKYNVGIWDATTGEFVEYKKKDEGDLQFSHRIARVYAKYRFNKFLSAGFQAEFMLAKRSFMKTIIGGIFSAGESVSIKTARSRLAKMMMDFRPCLTSSLVRPCFAI